MKLTAIVLAICWQPASAADQELERLFYVTSPHVTQREMAAHGEAAVEFLLEKARTIDSESINQELAFSFLKPMVGKALVPRLAALAKHREARVAKLAVSLLAEVHDDACVEPLANALGQAELTKLAIRGLDEIGSLAALQALRSFSEQPLAPDEAALVQESIRVLERVHPYTDESRSFLNSQLRTPGTRVVWSIRQIRVARDRTLIPNLERFGLSLAARNVDWKPQVRCLRTLSEFGYRLELDEEQLAGLWDDLKDGKRGSLARWKLACAGDVSIRFLHARVLPIGPPTHEYRSLIRELDSDRLQTRRAAFKQLSESGILAEAALAQSLAEDLSPETQRSVELLLKGIRHQARETTPEIARRLRAITVAELVGSDEAVKFLEGIATGAPSAVETKHARIALGILRWNRKKDVVARKPQ